MQRKVIKQGNGTLTITLPKQWTQKVGLKGGDEIEIGERGNLLNVRFKGGSEELKKTSIVVRDMNSLRAIRWSLSALHKSGFDEIEVIYDDPKVLKMVQNEVNVTYTGFAIMEQSKKRVVLKSVSKDVYSELEGSLRRAFLVTLSLAESISERIKDNDLENMSELFALEKSNNKFTEFCERLLVKKGYQIPEKTCFKYIIVWGIEKVCDYFRDLCEYIDRKKIKSLSKETTQLYEEVLSFFRKYYNLIYKFDLIEFDKVMKEEKRLSLKIEEYKPKKSYEYKLIFILEEIIEGLLNLSGSLISLNY